MIVIFCICMWLHLVLNSKTRVADLKQNTVALYCYVHLHRIYLFILITLFFASLIYVIHIVYILLYFFYSAPS